MEIRPTLIKNNSFLLLFILIEGFSIFILLSNNRYQSNKFIKYSTQYTSVIYNYYDALTNYINLKETNEYLIKENAKLYSRIQKEKEHKDSYIKKDKLFTYQEAKVINNTINKRNNFITLNKGERHGIKEGMGVITSNGVIGIIHSVSKKYAIAISLLHRRSSIGIKLKKNNHNGILRWGGKDYRRANIMNFPNHINISQGDTITTNSHSLIFPEKIDLGTVSLLNKNEEGYYIVEVSLFEDFNKLEYVYIISSKGNEEQRQLENKLNE